MNEKRQGQIRDKIASLLMELSDKAIPTPTPAQVEEIVRLLTQNNPPKAKEVL